MSSVVMKEDCEGPEMVHLTGWYDERSTKPKRGIATTRG